MLDKKIKEKLLAIAREQEAKVIRLRDYSIKRNQNLSENRMFSLRIGEMFGVLKVLEDLEFEENELDEFQWIYEYGI